MNSPIWRAEVHGTLAAQNGSRQNTLIHHILLDDKQGATGYGALFTPAFLHTPRNLWLQIRSNYQRVLQANYYGKTKGVPCELLLKALSAFFLKKTFCVKDVKLRTKVYSGMEELKW